MTNEKRYKETDTHLHWNEKGCTIKSKNNNNDNNEDKAKRSVRYKNISRCETERWVGIALYVGGGQYSVSQNLPPLFTVIA